MILAGLALTMSNLTGLSYALVLLNHHSNFLINRCVMQRWLQVTVQDSDLWYSEYSRPVLVDGVIQKRTWNAERYTGKYPPLPTWEGNADLMKKFVPPLAVYHMAYQSKDSG